MPWVTRWLRTTPAWFGTSKTIAGGMSLRLPLRGEMPPLPAVIQPAVPGNAAEPGGEGTVPPEAVDGGKAPEEGLLGDLLRQGGIAAEGQGIAVDPGEIFPVDLGEIRQSASPFPPF